MAVPNVPMPNIPLLSMRTYAPRQMDRDLARVFEARGLSPVAGARLQAARVEMVNELQPGYTPVRTLEALEHYAACLAACERFPGHAAAERKCPWSTTWTDLGTVREDRLEWTVVLAHLGFVHAQAGVVHAKFAANNVHHLNAACKELQSGAGYFALIGQFKYSDSLPSGPAVGAVHASVYEHLFLAQAQACAVQRAVQSNYSVGLCSKLAQGAAEMFDKTRVLVKSLSKLMSRKVDWRHYVAMMSALFHMHSLKLAADDCVSKSGIGVAIAHLKAALKFHPGTKYTQKDVDLQSVLDSLRSTITAMIVKLDTENRVVYFDKEPAPENTPKVEGLVMVKVAMPDLDSRVDQEIVSMLKKHAESPPSATTPPPPTSDNQAPDDLSPVDSPLPSQDASSPEEASPMAACAPDLLTSPSWQVPKPSATPPPESHESSEQLATQGDALPVHPEIHDSALASPHVPSAGPTNSPAAPALQPQVPETVPPPESHESSEQLATQGDTLPVHPENHDSTLAPAHVPSPGPTNSPAAPALQPQVPETVPPPESYASSEQLATQGGALPVHTMIQVGAMPISNAALQEVPTPMIAPVSDLAPTSSSQANTPNMTLPAHNVSSTLQQLQDKGKAPLVCPDVQNGMSPSPDVPSPEAPDPLVICELGPTPNSSQQAQQHAVLVEQYQAAKLGLSVKAYRVKKEQEAYELRKQSEQNSLPSGQSSRQPLTIEEEEAHLARALEISMQLQ